MAYTSPTEDRYDIQAKSWVPSAFQPVSPQPSSQENAQAHRWQMVAASVFLVSVPVFFQAPLVRAFPLISLVLTIFWFGIAKHLKHQSTTAHWGDLLIGFSWTWLAGSIYWGWLRWEPFLHLPIESIGLPFAFWGLYHQRGKIGHWFYLGSLLGTAITDAYFYLVRLIPYWREIMRVPPEGAQNILHHALQQMQTPWGYSCASMLVALLLVIGLIPLRSKTLHWSAFSGAVLSTLLVDGLFWVAATIA